MLWIDTDMGFDDLLAIIMITQSQREIAGVSLVFGNAPLENVRRNAAGARQLFGWTFPFHLGAEHSILGSVDTPGHVLGPTGIPTRGKTLPECPPCDGTPALAAIIEWLEGLDTPGEILALGPLTNLAILTLARPDLLPKIANVTWMGGGATSGNQTASAEFNAYADPEAIHILLCNGVPLKVVDLDLCRQVLIGPDDLTRLHGLTSEKGQVLHDLCGAYVDIALNRGRDRMAIYDPTAAACLLIPDAFQFEEGEVTVELAGKHTRGRTILDQRPGTKPNCTWGKQADGDRVLDYILNALEQAAHS